MKCFLILGMLFSISLGIPLDYDSNIQIDPHSWLQKESLQGKIIGNERRDLPRACGGKPADIYFAFDTSRDVTKEQYLQQKDYAKDLLQIFHLGENDTRIGTVIYGETTKLQTNLQDTGDENYMKASWDKSNDVVGGHRKIGQAIRYLRKRGFSVDFSRPGVAQVAVIFTGGEPSDYQNAILQAQLARRYGIYIYIVTLNTPSYDVKKKLSYLASQPSSNFVYSMDHFAITESLVLLLKIHLCDVQIHPSVATPESRVCQAKRPVDVIFSVDEISIGARNSQKIFHLIEALTSEFDEQFVNIALVNNKNINFGNIGKQFEDVDNFISKLGSIRVPNHSDLLRKIRRISKKGRPNVQKTAIHFIDENVDITKQTLVEAKLNKAIKLETYVIAVGRSLDSVSVKAIASGPSDQHVIEVNSYQLLVGRWRKIIKSICKGW